MQKTQEQPLPEVGNLDFEVWGGGRHGRRNASRFKLRCDAIALHESEILLLSVVAPETSVKALTAGLRASGKDQKRIEYSAHVGNIHASLLTKCQEGYRIFRSKLDFGLWHVLCLGKRVGFMPVLTEDSLWKLLQGSQITTPLLREWVPWLVQTMKKRKLIKDLTQAGCQAGLLLADSDNLDGLVSEGLKQGDLALKGHRQRRTGAGEGALGEDIQNLDQYMLAFGPMLGTQAERSLDPLHVPGRDNLRSLDLLRDTFEAQGQVIEAASKALKRQKALLLVGEMGTGKTLMSMAAVQAHAGGWPYRALVFCRGQLVHKWERELRETIPDAKVIQIENWKNLLHLKKSNKPVGAEWYIIARDRAKLGGQMAACLRLQ